MRIHFRPINWLLLVLTFALPSVDAPAGSVGKIAGIPLQLPRVGIGSGAYFLADTKTELTNTRLRSQALEDHLSMVVGAPASAAESAAPMRAVGLRTAESHTYSAEESLAMPPVLGPVLGTKWPTPW